MPAYSIVAVTVHDQQLFQHYVEGHKGTLDKYGGRFLIASSDYEMIEGKWPGQVVVVHEWPDRDAFNAWYTSSEYKPWKEKRFASAQANVVLVDGLSVDIRHNIS